MTFLGPAKPSQKVIIFAYITVEHMKGRSIVSATESSTSDVFIELVEKEIIEQFGPLIG